MSGNSSARSGQSEQHEVRSGQSCGLGVGQRSRHDLVFYSKQHRLHPIGTEEPLKGFKQNFILIRFVRRIWLQSRFG